MIAGKLKPKVRRKKPRGALKPGVRPITGVMKPKVPTPAPPAPKQVTTTPGPAGTPPNHITLTPHPSTTPAPPPPLPSSEAERQAALAELTGSKADLNYQRYLAALKYGDQGVLQNFSQYGPVVDNPLSELSMIARDEAVNKRDLAEGENRNNTFFSGLHLRDLGNLEQNAGFQRVQALQNYQEAERDLTNQLAQAQRNYDERTSRALAADLEAAQQRDREAAGVYDNEGTDYGKEDFEDDVGTDVGGAKSSKKKSTKKSSKKKSPKKKAKKPAPVKGASGKIVPKAKRRK